MFSEVQKSQIRQLKDVTQRSDLLILAVLLYYQWDVDKSMEFILNSGDQLSEDLIPPSRKQSAAKMLKQEEEALLKLQQERLNKGKQEQTQNNSNISIDQRVNTFEKQLTKSQRIAQIKENLQQLENVEWEFNSKIYYKKLIIKNNQNDRESNNLQLRMHQSFMGIKKCEKSGFFNCIYQVLFQNPDIVGAILNLNIQNKDDQNSNYQNELQNLFGSLILSNDKYVRNSELYIAASRLNKSQVYNGEINFAVQFENQLGILKQFFQVVNKQDYVNMIQNQFYTFQNTLFLKLEQEDRVFQLSLLKQIDNLQQFGQSQNFKQYQAFEIIRKKLDDDEDNSQNNLDYWFPEKIDLEFLVLKDKAEKVLKILEDAANEEKIKDIKINQQILNNLLIAKSILSEQEIIQIETVEALQSEKKQIKKKLKDHIPFNIDSLQKSSQNTRFCYSLQATVIELKGVDYQIFYLYIKNFDKNQWYRISDCQVQVVSENIVFKDTRKYGCFLIYVQQEQIKKIQEHQQKLSEIAKMVLKNQEEFILNNYPLLQKFQQSDSRKVEKIVKANQINYNKLNEELNDEFNQ